MSELYIPIKGESMSAHQEAVELEVKKQEMRERALRTGRLELMGPLAPVGERENWTGDISLDKRLESGELTEARVQTAYELLGGSYVRTSEGASLRCIDGRIMLGYNDLLLGMFLEKLGPQVPGGSAVQALLYRIAMGGQDGSYADADLKQDIGIVAKANQNMLFLPGDHVDNKQTPDRTGCRAIDGVEEHLGGINPKTVSQVEAITKAFLGDKFNPNHFDHMLASATRLLAVKDHYFIEKDDIIAAMVAHNPKAAPVLAGKHNEIFVVVNMVRNETLHRDYFASQSGGEIQAFGYDFWYSFDIAEAMFPDDTEKQSKFVHARLAMATTALMDLTDGSLRLVFRMPNENSSQPEAA